MFFCKLVRSYYTQKTLFAAVQLVIFLQQLYEMSGSFSYSFTKKI